MSEKTGIFIHEIDDKHVWLIYYHKGMRVYKQPLALTFREYLKSAHQKDIDSGEVAKGFQPETAFAKIKLSDLVDKEIVIA